jgi:hypothetical protein
VVQGVLELVASEVSTVVCKEDKELQAFYRRTVAYIRQQQENTGRDAGGGKYTGLKIFKKSYVIEEKRKYICKLDRLLLICFAFIFICFVSVLLLFTRETESVHLVVIVLHSKNT